MDAIELGGLGLWSFTVALAGGLAGMVLGNLRLPLVVLLASSPAAAAGANVAISGVGALTASATHAREGRVDWGLFAWMAPPSLVGGILGGVISGELPDRVLLGAIAVVVLLGAVEVLRHARRSGQDSPEPSPERSHAVPAILIGFVVGVLGGIVGLILGTLRLPAMVKWVGTAPHAAVGTNSAVGVVVGLGGLLGHLAGEVDWELFAVGAAATIPGAYLGAQLTGRLSERSLLRAIATILVLTGLAMLAQAVIG